MPYYLLQASYSHEAWVRMTRKRKAAGNNGSLAAKTIKPVVERQGGKYRDGWISFGEYDAVVIMEMADNKAAAAVSIALSAGTDFKAVKTTPLMTVEEGRAALKAVK